MILDSHEHFLVDSKVIVTHQSVSNKAGSPPLSYSIFYHFNRLAVVINELLRLWMWMCLTHGKPTKACGINVPGAKEGP